MKRFKNFTLKTKLTLIIMTTSAIAVLVACLVFITYSIYEYHQYHISELTTLTEAIGQNCHAALKFDIPEDAEKTLMALDADPGVVFGVIYRPNGEVFATYNAKGNEDKPIPPVRTTDSHEIKRGYLNVFHKIEMCGDTLGYIYLHDNMQKMRSVISRTAIALWVVIAMAMVFAYLISGKLQNFVAKPILTLTRAAARVAKDNDYSVRAKKLTGGQLGQLTDTFNYMLSHIQDSAQEREQLMRTLAAKNEELESIVFISSHDLRSPLVNIQGFSGELDRSCNDIKKLLEKHDVSLEVRKQFSDLLQNDIALSLEYISNSTARMDMLLKGLLKLSRLGRAAMDIQKLDMNNLLKEILQTMRFQINQMDVDIEVDDLPECCGDDSQIKQVFSNLINNAIKYRSPDKRIKIHISGKKENSKSIYCVEDNGMGIAKEYYGRIFEIFHRLNPDKKAEGEGLGLTIVRRILDRHNGRIWVESEYGKGSKFYIELHTKVPSYV